MQIGRNTAVAATPPPPWESLLPTPHRLLTQSYYLVSQPTLCVFVNIHCSLFFSYSCSPSLSLSLSLSLTHSLSLSHSPSLLSFSSPTKYNTTSFPSQFFSSRIFIIPFFYFPFLYYYRYYCYSYFTPTKNIFILIIIEFHFLSYLVRHVFKGIPS